MKMKFTIFVMCLIWAFIQQTYGQNFTDRKEYKMANSHWFSSSLSGNTWYYDMRVSPPTQTPFVWSARSSYETIGAISDTATGDLLFYTNGSNMYNRNHDIMPNGTRVAINAFSTTQAALIVPMIDSPNKFHVFILTYQNVSSGHTGLYYNVVDMSLDNGLGDVDPERKFIKIYDEPLSEAMIGIPGNNCDVWVMLHGGADSNFVAFHITSEGLDFNPIFSSPGTNEIGVEWGFDVSAMSVSPQRDKIVISSMHVNCPLNPFPEANHGGLMMVKFDPETGMVGEGAKIDDYLRVECTFSAFSPSGQYLYIIAQELDSNFKEQPISWALYQYDVSSFSKDSIFSSKYEVSPMISNSSLRLNGDTMIVSGNLAFLENPNGAKAACLYNDTSDYFSKTYYSASINLGTTAIYPLPAIYLTNVTDTIVCNGTVDLFATSGFSTYRWNKGTTDNADSVFTVSESGTYWVEYEKGCHSGVDSFYVIIENFSTPVITVNEKDLATSESYDTYQWMLDGAAIPNATSQIYKVLENGDYQVIASRGRCLDTSDVYRVNNATGLALRSESNIQVYPNPVLTMVNIKSKFPVEIAIIGLEGKVYKKEFNVSGMDIKDLTDGIYLIEIRNNEGHLLMIEKIVKKSN